MGRSPAALPQEDEPDTLPWPGKSAAPETFVEELPQVRLAVVPKVLI